MIELVSPFELSDFGNWSSIIGVNITIVTFLLVLGIKKKFLFRSGVEEGREGLSKISSEVSGLLRSFSENMEDIDDAFAIAEVKLRNIEKGADGYLLSDVKNSRVKIKKYNIKTRFFRKINNKTESSAREINTSINVVIEELKNVSKEILVGK